MVDYPRNMIPLKDDVVRVLAAEGAIALYFAAIEGPVAPEDLAQVTGLPRDRAIALAGDLLAAGLLRDDDGQFIAGPRHVREDDFSAPGRTAFRLALIDHAQGVINDARSSIRAREDARAGISVVTLADDPETALRAMTIIAEAEDQLRALAEDAPPASAARRLRILFFTGSMLEPSSAPPASAEPL